MQRIFIIFFLFFSSSAFTEEIYCKKYGRTLTATTGNLEMSITVPEDDLGFEFIYKKNLQNEWVIDNFLHSQDLEKNIKKRFVRGLKKLEEAKNHNGNFTLNDFYKIFGLNLNYIRWEKMNTNEGLNYINQLSRKELSDAIDQLVLIFSEFEPGINNYFKKMENEILQFINEQGYYLKFDKYSEKNNKILLSANSIPNTSVFEVNAIILNSNNKSKRSSIEFSGIAGDTVYKYNYEGDCENSILINNNTSSGNTNNIKQKLRDLKELFEEELITKEEYDAKKKEILDDM